MYRDANLEEAMILLALLVLLNNTNMTSEVKKAFSGEANLRTVKLREPTTTILKCKLQEHRSIATSVRSVLVRSATFMKKLIFKALEFLKV